VLYLRRTHSLLGTDAGRGLAWLKSPTLRVYVTWMTGGLRFDSGVLGITPAEASIGDRAISIQLGGEMGVRAGGREAPVREGEVAAMHLRSWDERWEGAFRVLVVEWNDPTSRGRADLDGGRMGGADRAAFAAFASRLEGGELRGEGAAPAVLDLLARLRALGLPAPHPEAAELLAGLPEGAQAVADAVGRTLSRLPAGPHIDDIAAQLGMSGRHLRRRLSALGPWLPTLSAPEGWRRHLRIVRATLAASFLTHRDASLEQVARSLGYGSSRALLLALAQERLPPPRVLRAV
jgi:AraC-like DNA-binding protein